MILAFALAATLAISTAERYDDWQYATSCDQTDLDVSELARECQNYYFTHNNTFQGLDTLVVPLTGRQTLFAIIKPTISPSQVSLVADLTTCVRHYQVTNNSVVFTN